MIPSRKLHYEFGRRIHRVKSKFSGTLSVESIDSFLNEGLLIWFKNRVSLAEENSAVRNDLRQFEKKQVSLTCNPNKEYCVAEFPKDFYKLLRQTAVATKDDCGERKLLTHIVQSDDLDELLKDPYWKPSYEWEETLADEASKGLYIFHNGDFDVTNVLIDYYRKPGEIKTPSRIEGGSYEDEEGKIVTKDQNLEVDSTFAWREIVDIAVLVALRDLSDFPEFESQLSKMLTVERLHTN